MAENKPCLIVAPFVCGTDSPLSHVDDVFNGILVCGSMLGESLFYGKGAGKLPTASAVCADIIDAAKTPDAGNVPLRWTATDDNLSSMEIKTKLCVIAKADSDAAKAAMAMAAHVSTINGLCASLIDRPVGYEEIANIEKDL